MVEVLSPRYTFGPQVEDREGLVSQVRDILERHRGILLDIQYLASILCTLTGTMILEVIERDGAAEYKVMYSWGDIQKYKRIDSFPLLVISNKMYICNHVRYLDGKEKLVDYTNSFLEEFRRGRMYMGYSGDEDVRIRTMDRGIELYNLIERFKTSQYAEKAE